jgi:hypothetical protein
MTLKHIKIPQDISIKEMVKYFGPIVNKTSHNYIYNQGLMLIEKVEKLWMVIHQKCYVLITWVVFLNFSTRVTMRMVGKQMNWLLYVKWINQKQQQRRRDVLEILNDTKDERDVIDDVDFRASSDCTKPSFVP